MTDTGVRTIQSPLTGPQPTTARLLPVTEVEEAWYIGSRTPLAFSSELATPGSVLYTVGGSVRLHNMGTEIEEDGEVFSIGPEFIDDFGLGEHLALRVTRPGTYSVSAMAAIEGAATPPAGSNVEVTLLVNGAEVGRTGRSEFFAAESLSAATPDYYALASLEGDAQFEDGDWLTFRTTLIGATRVAATTSRIYTGFALTNSGCRRTGG